MGARLCCKALIVALSLPEPISEEHDLSRFCCGKPALDQWLKTRSLSNARKGFTSVVVVHDDGRVVGYYGLAPTAVASSALPRSIRTGQPPEPVPCLLLGHLATDLEYSGRGIGTGLLKHAYRRCVQAADLIGGRALVVNAIDDEAAKFWLRQEFVPSKENPLILFQSMERIAASI